MYTLTRSSLFPIFKQQQKSISHVDYFSALQTGHPIWSDHDADLTIQGKEK